MLLLTHAAGRLLSPAANGTAIAEYLRVVLRRRELTWDLAKREFTERYAGQVFGVVWGVAHPLIIILVYLFIFDFVFRTQMGDDGSRGLFGFSVYMLAGLVPWLTVAEVLSKSTAVVSGNVNLVKQVIFPVEVLPTKAVIASFLTQVILTLALLAYALLRYHAAPWTWALAPAVLLVQLVGMFGLSLLLSSLAPYFKDLKDVVQVFCLINVYLMPVVYLPNLVPRAFQPFLYVNPFSYQTWCFQDVFYFGRIAHPWAWPPFVLLNVLALGVGYRVFNTLRSSFGNVL
jgi:lipopolysaccharide transport system permease protein